MAPLNMHVVVGEQVFSQTQLLSSHPTMYGPFLLGCILVDIHGFRPFSRAHTHFSERLVTDGPLAIEKSCDNFLEQLPSLVARPFPHLTDIDQAFLAGYACHLAVDEEWKLHDWYLIHERGINVWRELEIPGSVLLTAFSALSQEIFYDFPSVAAVLHTVTVPDTLTHIPYTELVAMWHLVREHILDEKSGVESFLRMRQAQGVPPDTLAIIRREHEQYWSKAVEAVYTYLGHPQERLPSMTRRAIDVMPRLFQRLTTHTDSTL